jgi:Radical SAM superfamily
MIKKVLVFGDFFLADQPEALKSAAVLRISNMFRKENFTVKQIHHCTSFNKDELEKIIIDFAKNDEIIVCVSTSFLTTLSKKNMMSFKINGALSYWVEPAFKFFITIGLICKQYKIKLFMGGWPLTRDLGDNLGYSILSRYYDYFVIGNNIQEIVNYCKTGQIKSDDFYGAKIINAAPILDYSDISSKVDTVDVINHQESLLTEIAAGCIFSCSFCNYATLGKKKYEFMRSYDSLKNEIVSNYNNFGTRIYTFTDNIMNDYHVKLEWLKQIRQETDIDLRWTGYVRLDTIKTVSQAQLLKDSGIASCIFGIESLKKEVGPYFGKITDKTKLLESLKIFRDVLGDTCLTTGSFIAGAPTETKDELQQTFEWLISDQGRYYIDNYFFTPLVIFQNNNDKNDINRARNNPFRDYITKGFRWTSPWGTSEEFAEIINQYNLYSFENLNYSKFSGFNLPIISNYGFAIEDIISAVRNKKSILTDKRSVNNQNFIQNYKKKVLELTE